MDVKKIAKRGHSLGVALPSTYARKLGWIAGDFIAFELVNDALVLRNMRDCTVSLAKRMAKETPVHGARA